MRKIIALLLISTQAFAGLPPTTSRGISDTANQTTFNFQFPSLVPTRTGTTTSFSPPEKGAYTKNYVTYGNAESNATTGWAVYADAAGTSPVDGTGGSPSVTISTSSSSPLSGTYSYLLAKDAANRQGNGWSYDFTIDSGDKAKVLQISFDYIVSSGTFVAGSDSTTSDVTVWIYDVTNGVVIQPTSYKFLSNSSTTATRFISNFQTASNSTSYRLILHVGSTSASAYTLKADSVVVSPSTYVYGTPITDWHSYTPSTNGFTTSSMSAFWRRVGDSIQVSAKFTKATHSAAEMRLGLPSGLTSADTSKIASIKIASDNVISNANTPATSPYIYVVLIEPSVTYFTFGMQGTGNNGLTKQNGNNYFGATDILSFNASAPIQGWSSSVQTSDQADSRVVAMEVRGNFAGMDSSTNAKFTSITRLNDTHGAYNSSTGIYTVPVAGWYEVVLNFDTATGGNTYRTYIYKNGSQDTFLGLGWSGSVGISGKSYYNAGDQLSIRSASSMAAYTASCGMSINRIASPSVISATETVAASYYLSANQTTAAQVNFDTREYDTHGAVTTGVGAWKFTAPVSGLYLVNAANMEVVSGSIVFTIFKNGSSHKPASYVASAVNAFGTSLIKLNAGDYIDIRPSSSTTVMGGALAASNTSRVEIIRVGN